jgi:hypothetical protein
MQLLRLARFAAMRRIIADLSDILNRCVGVIGIEAFSEASDASRSARALRLRPQSAPASACELAGRKSRRVTMRRWLRIGAQDADVIGAVLVRLFCPMRDG